MSSAVTHHLLIPLAKSLVVAIYPLIMVIIMIWFERRVVAWIQIRLGPNRVGFEGVLQPIADAVKLFFKEDIIQCRADRLLFTMGPALSLFAALFAFCFIPIGGTMQLGRYSLTFWVAESPVGILIILGISAISVFGLIFGGWAGNSKYPLLGALRAVVQIISYEIPIGLTLLTVILLSGSMNLIDVVEQQQASRIWYVFVLPVSFAVYWISAIAETNRAPFDLPEAESELVAGYQTEYSGMKFGYYYMAEYAHMVLASSLAVVFFFGGWLPPFPNAEFLSFLHLVPGFIWYFLKVMFFLYLFVWIRGTFPRYRFDELIKLNWKWLVPLSLANLLVVAFIKVL